MSNISNGWKFDGCLYLESNTEHFNFIMTRKWFDPSLEKLSGSDFGEWSLVVTRAPSKDGRHGWGDR